MRSYESASKDNLDAVGDSRLQTPFWRFTVAVLRPTIPRMYRLRVYGRENLPANGGAILAANHASYIDPPLLGIAALPRVVRFMAKKSLFELPVLGRAIKALHAFPVDRDHADRGAITSALAVLQQGCLLGIFPQGTRVKDVPLEFNQGVALLAEKSGAPVIPVALSGTEGVWTKGVFPFRFPRLSVSFGRPLYYERVQGRAARIDRAAFIELLAVKVGEQFDVIKSASQVK